jgi:hypothetical protein
MLYACATTPLHWVATDPDAEVPDRLFLFPAIRGGWSQRQPYRGNRLALSPVSPLSAIGTGWPGDSRERK